MPAPGPAPATARHSWRTTPRPRGRWHEESGPAARLLRPFLPKGGPGRKLTRPRATGLDAGAGHSRPRHSPRGGCPRRPRALSPTPSSWGRCDKSQGRVMTEPSSRPDGASQRPDRVVTPPGGRGAQAEPRVPSGRQAPCSGLTFDDDRDAERAGTAGAEERFAARRPGGCHGGTSGRDGTEDRDDRAAAAAGTCPGSPARPSRRTPGPGRPCSSSRRPASRCCEARVLYVFVFSIIT